MLLFNRIMMKLYRLDDLVARLPANRKSLKSALEASIQVVRPPPSLPLSPSLPLPSLSPSLSLSVSQYPSLSLSLNTPLSLSRSLSLSISLSLDLSLLPKLYALTVSPSLHHQYIFLPFLLTHPLSSVHCSHPLASGIWWLQKMQVWIPM